MTDVETRVALATEATNLSDLLTYVLGPRGRNGRWLCPFHDDKHPDLRVKGDRFNCFACGAHGSAIQFLRDYNKWTFFQALEYLEDRAGLRPQMIGPAVKRELERRKKEREEEELRRRVRWILLSRELDGVRNEIRGAKKVLEAPIVADYMARLLDRKLELEVQMMQFEQGEA